MNQQENFNALIQGLQQILSDEEKVKSIRPSQKKILEEFIMGPEYYKKGIFDLATAFGKTRMMALLAEAYRKNSQQQIIVVEPTQELVQQISEEFSIYFNDPTSIGKFYADEKNTSLPILITTYNSLDKLTQKILPETVGLVLLDEGHHAVSEKRMETVRKFTNACQYGMTATPDYSEDRTLKNLLENTIAHVDIRQGINGGILSPFSNLVLSSKFELDLSQIRKNGLGEYDIVEYRQAFSKALSPMHMPNTQEADWRTAHRKIAGEIALFYQGLAQLKKHCMINCNTQEEAQIQAEEINKLFAQNVAGVWTSETKGSDSLSNFENGKLNVLCQVGMLQEGYDFPALDLCINYPTASWVRATQRGGRTLRLDPENPQKEATIVDVIFNFPGSKNPYTSARKNGQVLYSDVVQSIYVAPACANKKEAAAHLSFPDVARLHLQHFNVITDVQTLLSLKRKDQQKVASEYVPLKQEGMLSVNDIAQRLGGTPYKYAELFQKIYEDKETNFFANQDGEKTQLISRVRSGNSETFCLSAGQEAMTRFMEICAEKYHRRNCNKIPLEEYAQGHYLPFPELKEICAYLQQFRFQFLNEYGAKNALIAKIPNQDNFSLADTEKARLDLHALIGLTDYLKRVPPILEGMCDIDFFMDKMGLEKQDFKSDIARAVLEGITYQNKEGKENPLAQIYRGTDTFYNREFFSVCVPKEAAGQKELLTFLGFKIFEQDAFKISTRHGVLEAFKEYQEETLSLRDLSKRYYLTGARIHQIFRTIKQKMLSEIEKQEKKAGFTGKTALLVHGRELEFLTTKAALSKKIFHSVENDYSFDKSTSFSRILRLDQFYRSREE